MKQAQSYGRPQDPQGSHRDSKHQPYARQTRAKPLSAPPSIISKSLLRREQIDCERQAVVDGRENLIAVVHATTGGSTSGGLLLNSHIDTVPVANMAISPFDPVLKDGRIFGRGSCDAKASIAAMLAALLAHAQRPERPRPVLFLATVDEEFSFAGSRRFIERQLAGVGRGGWRADGTDQRHRPQRCCALAPAGSRGQCSWRDARTWAQRNLRRGASGRVVGTVCFRTQPAWLDTLCCSTRRSMWGASQAGKP